MGLPALCMLHLEISLFSFEHAGHNVLEPNKTMTVFQTWPSEPLRRTICLVLYISTMEGEVV